jgi:hypothetical protein
MGGEWVLRAPLVQSLIDFGLGHCHVCAKHQLLGVLRLPLNLREQQFLTGRRRDKRCPIQMAIAMVTRLPVSNAAAFRNHFDGLSLLASAPKRLAACQPK